MKKLIPIFIGALTVVASASTVNWGVDNDFNMVLHDAQGALLRTGSLIRIGTFSLTDIQIMSMAEPTPSNISALDAAFTPFGTQTFRIGQGGFDAGAVAAVSSQTFGASNPLLNAQVYIWALKSTTDTSVQLSLSSAFQQAIFYRNKGIDADWQFPGDISPASTIDAGDLRNGAGTGLASGGVILAGSFVSNSVAGAAYNGGPTSAIQLAQAVPEPTSAFLIAVGAAGLMMRRRRQS